MELTPVQKRICEELAASPLAWVGSGWVRGKTYICCPASGDPWGSAITEATFQSLRRKGLLQHGKLSEEQRSELARRMEKWGGRRSVPTHGYLFNKEALTCT